MKIQLTILLGIGVISFGQAFAAPICCPQDVRFKFLKVAFHDKIKPPPKGFKF